MLPKTMLAIGAVASIGLLAPDEVLARGGFGGGGFRGGGGFHGGGFRAAGIGMGGAGFRAASVNGGFRSGAIAPGLRGGTFAGNAWRAGFHPGYRPWRPIAAAAVVGAGLAYGAYPYGYYDNYYAQPYYASYPYDYDGNFVYNGGYYGNGCYIVQQRFPTPYGWVLRPMQVCD